MDRKTMMESEAARGYLESSLGLNAEECPELSSFADEELRFVLEMVRGGLNREKAYRKAFGCEDSKSLSKGAVLNRAARLLQRREMRLLLRTCVERALGQMLDNVDAKVLSLMCTRAFYDISDFFYSNGECRPLDEIDEAWRGAIDGVSEQYYGKQADVRVVTYKLADREKSLSKLAEYMQLVRETPAAKAEVTIVQAPAASGEREAQEMLSRIGAMSDDELTRRIHGFRSKGLLGRDA